MRLEEITEKTRWEDFLATMVEKSFLQSWNWGEYNTAMQNPCWRFGILENDRIVAIAQVFKVAAKRGTFLYVPHGPVFDQSLPLPDKQELLLLLLTELKALAAQEKASFIRLAPLMLRNEQNESLLVQMGLRPSPMHSSAYEATWKLDLKEPEDALMAKMRKTTRYLIRKASENKDITIEASSNPEDIHIYQELNRHVAQRQKFIGFSNAAIAAEFNAFSPESETLLFFGKYKGEVAAGAMIIFWSGIGFYHQAASKGMFAKHSIPYLLQWEAIKEAKRRGCAIYDFWGFTDPGKFPAHPWAGPTLFKMGFGGYATEYVATQDLVVSRRYWFNYIIESIRKKMRGL
jgi:lipid II:glycine glycyltransferase (peptidoglycan interpeptide bridge formation enzyme)